MHHLGIHVFNGLEPSNESIKTSIDAGDRTEKSSTICWWGDFDFDNPGITKRKSEGRLSQFEFRQGRGEWANKAEFFLSCLGFSVGLGNVLRFPHLAYQNGGGVFFMAYMVLQFLVGKPMYLMELSLGQFSGKSPSRLWDMHPAAQGIGLSMCVISLITAVYYNVIIAYTFYYFFACMQHTLPWTVCDDEWVEKYRCVSEHHPQCTTDTSAMEERGACQCSGQATIDNSFSFNCTEKTPNATTAAELYFYIRVLQLSPGIEPQHFGTPIPKLAFYLFCSWTVVTICVIKGIKSSGKVVYFTATFPYFILLAILVRNSFLDGAWDGAKYFLVPEWSKLTNPLVWKAAASQMFFSLSVSFGGIIMYGSYNKFQYKVYPDAMAIASLDLMSSLIGGLVVFTTFGALAKSLGYSVNEVTSSDSGLAFIAYPEALSHMPPAHLWAMLFFFMLFTLGLDTEFALMETVLIAIQDQFIKMRAYKGYLCIGTGLVCYVLGLPCICPGGDYVVNILDQHGPDVSVLGVACCETIAVMWGYGVMNFLKDLEYMLGKRPYFWQYWAFSWAFTCPLVTGTLFVYRIASYGSLRYDSGVEYPRFAQVIAWMLTAAALCPMPLWFLYMVVKSFFVPEITTWKERKVFLFSPNHHWVPNDDIDYEFTE